MATVIDFPDYLELTAEDIILALPEGERAAAGFAQDQESALTAEQWKLLGELIRLMQTPPD
jgi:hypothetical protein